MGVFVGASVVGALVVGALVVGFVLGDNVAPGLVGSLVGVLVGDVGVALGDVVGVLVGCRLEGAAVGDCDVGLTVVGDCDGLLGALLGESVEGACVGALGAGVLRTPRQRRPPSGMTAETEDCGGTGGIVCKRDVAVGTRG